MTDHPPTKTWYGASLCWLDHYPFIDDCKTPTQYSHDDYDINLQEKWLIAFCVFIIPLFVSCFVGCFVAQQTAKRFKREMDEEDYQESTNYTESSYNSTY